MRSQMQTVRQALLATARGSRVHRSVRRAPEAGEVVGDGAVVFVRSWILVVGIRGGFDELLCMGVAAHEGEFRCRRFCCMVFDLLLLLEDVFEWHFGQQRYGDTTFS